MDNIKKYDFIKKKFDRKALSYYSFLVWLIDNSANLMDFIISKREIENQYLNIKFNYDSFILEFSKIPELQCYDFCKDKYNDEIYHITLKGRKISPKYSPEVISEIVSNNYDTKNVQDIINKKSEWNAETFIKLGIERFYENYKSLKLEKENVIISEEFFFNNFVYPFDGYMIQLCSNPDFKDDYNKYLRKYKSLDFYLDTINEVMAVRGLELIKKQQNYTFTTVPKSHKEKNVKNSIRVETRKFGSFNLSSNSVRLDGSYGDHTLRDSISGRYYSTPSYDNYGHDSGPD